MEKRAALTASPDVTAARAKTEKRMLKLQRDLPSRAGIQGALELALSEAPLRDGVFASRQLPLLQSKNSPVGVSGRKFLVSYTVVNRGFGLEFSFFLFCRCSR